MGDTVLITYTTKTLNQAARMQEQFITQMGVLGYKLGEFKAIPDGNKVSVTLTLVRKK